MTFGSEHPAQRINLLVAVIGLFGISESCSRWRSGSPCAAMPRHQPARGAEGVEGTAARLGDAAALSVIGCWLGITPGGDRGLVHGLQPGQAVFQGQGQFRQGRIEGVFAPETAAHASGTAALLPMLALGFPAPAPRRSCSAV